MANKKNYSSPTEFFRDIDTLYKSNPAKQHTGDDSIPTREVERWEQEVAMAVDGLANSLSSLSNMEELRTIEAPESVKQFAGIS